MSVSKRKAVVSLSGGMDSTTLLGRVMENECCVLTVGFTYGSKHNQYENEAARNVARHYGVPFRLIDLTSVMAGFKSDLMKSGGEIPEGHYEAESMKRTVVPARNMIFTSVLAGVAWSDEAEEVWLGIHAGDHHIYPDCRPLFYRCMNEAVQAGTDNRVVVRAPYLYLTKAQIVTEGVRLGVPYHLTRTCYKDSPIACGRCGSCQERLEAFKINRVSDPIRYESTEILPK